VAWVDSAPLGVKRAGLSLCTSLNLIEKLARATTGMSQRASTIHLARGPTDNSSRRESMASITLRSSRIMTDRSVMIRELRRAEPAVNVGRERGRWPVLTSPGYQPHLKVTDGGLRLAEPGSVATHAGGEL